MKTKIRKVYYCDFCKKHALRPLWRHETHCTRNPMRVCKLCDRSSIWQLVEKYKKFIANGEKITLEDIYHDIENECPVCTLTLIRCAGLKDIDFDYKKELADWWEEKNSDNWTNNIEVHMT